MPHICIRPSIWLGRSLYSTHSYCLVFRKNSINWETGHGTQTHNKVMRFVVETRNVFVQCCCLHHLMWALPGVQMCNQEGKKTRSSITYPLLVQSSFLFLVPCNLLVMLQKLCKTTSLPLVPCILHYAFGLHPPCLTNMFLSNIRMITS